MLAIAAAAMLQVAAASPAPDLSQYLAPAPGADWVEAPAGPDVINGPFTAHEWAVYVDDTPTEVALNLDGFVGGYGRAWEQKVTQDFLEEQVFQFRSAKGARYMYNAFKLNDQTDGTYKRDFPTWDSKNAWGAEFQNEDGDRLFGVLFLKGALLFIVNLYTGDADLSVTAEQIARAEFEGAPESTELTASTSVIPRQAIWIIGLAMFVLALLTSIVVFVLLRRRQGPGPLLAGDVQVTPDGAYWWDGTRWRSSATDIPPGAQRSPDGNYWWDGASWRRTRP